MGKELSNTWGGFSDSAQQTLSLDGPRPFQIKAQEALLQTPLAVFGIIIIMLMFLFVLPYAPSSHSMSVSCCRGKLLLAVPSRHTQQRSTARTGLPL